MEFPPDAEIRDELTRLVQLERECCPFLDLNIEENGDQGVVLTAGAPPEAEPILQDLLKPPGSR